MTVIIYYVFDPGLGIEFLIPIKPWGQDHVKLKLFNHKLQGGAHMGWNLLF